jgi:hypothetical protein
VFVAHRDPERFGRILPSEVRLTPWEGPPASLAVRVEAEVDARGGLRVTPAGPLAPGRYLLDLGRGGGASFDVSGSADVTPPGEVTGPEHVRGADGSAPFLREGSLRFSLAADATEVAYHVYASRAPGDPDTSGPPTYAAAVGRREGGVVTVPLLENCMPVLPPDMRGPLRVRLRAVDAAGNVGPPSEAVAFDRPAHVTCEAPSLFPGGCAAGAGGGAEGLVLLAALLHVRRRRAHARAAGPR